MRSKLTREIQRKICDLLAAGNTVVTACDDAGIGSRTFHDWIERGEAEQRGPNYEFCRAVARARAEAKRRLTARIISAAERDWKAAAWILEKLFPGEFGANAEIEAKSNNVGVKIYYDTGGQSLQELLEFPIDPSMKECNGKCD